jgi:hypothetical protein
VGRFRSIQPSKQALKHQPAAFAAFQGRKHDRDEEEGEPETDPSEGDTPARRHSKRHQMTNKPANSSNLGQTAPKCVCGLKHLFKNCYYLAPNTAPKD